MIHIMVLFQFSYYQILIDTKVLTWIYSITSETLSYVKCINILIFITYSSANWLFVAKQMYALLM